MKYPLSLLISFTYLLGACSNSQTTLEDYLKQPVEFEQKEVEYPNGDFSIFIPTEWIWKIENYEYDGFILGIDAASRADKDGFFDIMSIQKLKSHGNELESEFNRMIKLLDDSAGTLIESGETDIFGEQAYYFHTILDQNEYGVIETFNFVLKAQKQGEYYFLTASANSSVNRTKTMSIMIDCLLTFERERD